MNNTFEKVLRAVRGGDVVEELSEALADVVASVKRAGKPGKLRLTLTVKPSSWGASQMVMVEDEISAELAKPERPNTVFFVAEKDLLQREDPRQVEMGFKAGSSAAESLPCLSAVQEPATKKRKEK